MNKWFAVWVCLIALPAGMLRAQPVQLYIMAGQSNMAGSGNALDLPTEPVNYKLPQQVPFSYNLETGGHVSQGFEFLRPNIQPGAFGPELTFGRRLDEALDTPIGIIKVAASGSNLAQNWNPDAPLPHRALYLRMIDHINATTSQMGFPGVDFQFAGFLWTQGESDTSDELAPQYGDNLTYMIQQLRADLNTPELPVYISRLSQFTNYKNRMVLRAQQSQVARADPFATVVDTDHLELKFDLVHYTTQGQLDLGHAFADRILFGTPREDFDIDGLITDNDLNILINHWGLSAPAGDAGWGDADGDGFVGQADLSIVVDLIPPPPPPLDNGDLTGEGFVGIDDLTLLLANWNQDVPYGDTSRGDLNVDGFVGIADLTQLLTQWNTLVIDPVVFVPTPERLDLDGDGALGEGDLAFMFSQWSFLTDVDPVLPIGVVQDPIESDFNADGVVDIEDLRYLIAELPVGLRVAPADLDGDGFVGVDDLGRVLSNWNQSVPAGAPLLGDVNGDGFVGIDDLNLVLGSWNTGTPPAPANAIPEPAAGTVVTILWLAVGQRGPRPAFLRGQYRGAPT